MLIQTAHWRLCLVAALAALAGAYAASFRAAPAAERGSASDNVAVLHARLAHSADERRRLEEALQICELGRPLPGARDSQPRLPAVSAAGHAVSSGASVPPLAPEHRRGILLQRYGGLLRELALSPEQRDALLAALAELDPSAGLFPSLPPDLAREQAALAQVIGPDKAAEFQRLKLTLPARAEVRAVRDRLEVAGDELTGEQLEELTAVLSKHARALATPTPAASADETPQQRIARMRAWMHERERAFREAEATVLTPSQLQVLDSGRVPLHLLSNSAGGGQAGSRG